MTVHPRSPANTVSTLAIFINFSLALTDLTNLPGNAGFAGYVAALSTLFGMPYLFFILRLCFAAKLAHATDLTVVERDISTSGGRMQKILAEIKIAFEFAFHAFASFVEAFQLQGSKVSGRSVTFIHHLFLISSFTIGSNRNWIAKK